MVLLIYETYEYLILVNQKLTAKIYSFGQNYTTGFIK